jgi:inorganic triphosphatase YgiF
MAASRNPIELEAPVDRKEPDLAKIADKKIKRIVKKAAKGTPLKPVFETVVQRTTRTIKAQGSEIELAVDNGEVSAGDQAGEVREAELELKAGNEEGLLLAAENCLPATNSRSVRAARPSAATGWRFKRRARAVSPRKRGRSAWNERTPAPRPLPPCSNRRRQILVNREAVLETDDPNGTHQLRIGLRRLRSALWALRPLADGSSLHAFERSARDRGRCVGTLRDADVLISGIHAPVEAAALDKTGFAELLEMLRHERQRRRDEVRAALRGSSWTKLHLYLILWPRHP